MERRRATADLATLLFVYSLLPSGLPGEVPGLGQALQGAVGVPHAVNLRLSSVVSGELGASLPASLWVCSSQQEALPRGRRGGARRGRKVRAARALRACEQRKDIRLLLRARRAAHSAQVTDLPGRAGLLHQSALTRGSGGSALEAEGSICNPRVAPAGGAWRRAEEFVIKGVTRFPKAISSQRRRERIPLASGIETTDSVQSVFFEWTGVGGRGEGNNESNEAIVFFLKCGGKTRILEDKTMREQQ